MSAEQWRPLVAKYFRPEDVQKALYVIDHESGGNPAAVGDNGASHGLFQLNDNGLGAGMSVADRLDAAKNIAAAAKAVYGGSGWGPWGEGTSFQGKPFGSLGNNPYPGGSNMTAPAAAATSDMGDYQDFLDAYVGPRPQLSDFTDDGGLYGATKDQKYATAIKDYNTAVKQATAGYASYRTAIGKGVTSPDQKHQQDITNAIAAIDVQVRAGTLDASQAQNKLMAFINEQKNALDLGQQQLTANAELDKYGPGGTWDYNNAGAGFADYAKRNGIDPASSAISFTTPTPFDPAAAYQQNIQTMGGGGGPPGASSPGSASTAIARLIAGMSGADSSGAQATASTIQPPDPRLQPGQVTQGFGGVPAGYTGSLRQLPGLISAGYGGMPAIRPQGVDQNGNPVAPPPIIPGTHPGTTRE